jgi:hypothetical protein
MTNAQAQAYAVIALKRLMGSGYVRIYNRSQKELCRLLDGEMYCLFDTFTEEEAEEKAGRIFEE